MILYKTFGCNDSQLHDKLQEIDLNLKIENHEDPILFKCKAVEEN